MKDEYDVDVAHTPAKIEFEFEALRDRIQADVGRYDVVVTQDTVADSKRMRGELNKLASKLDRKRIDVKNDVLEPLAPFEERMKELKEIATNGAQKLDTQIAVFDQKRKDQARAALREGLRDAFAGHSIRPEHQTATIDDLVSLGAITATGNLTGQSVERIESRVHQDMARQARADHRLADFEARCYRAGLKEALSPNIVKPYIGESDEEYEQAVKRILDDELSRQERTERRVAQEAEARERKKQQEAEALERKKQQEAEAQSAKFEPEPEPEPAKPAPPPAAPPAADIEASPTKPSSDKVEWRSTVTLSVNAPQTATKEMIERKLRKVLIERGFDESSIVHIQAVPNGA